MSLAPGTRLGPYEILTPIGAGGMGEVYKATDTRLGRTVAIKVLPHDFSADPERRIRFEREARLIASLSHPHICSLHDIGSERSDGETVAYLVMEFLEGESLAARLARGALPLDETLRIGTAIAEALAAAHRANIVHRDLKPANVMLTRGGVKLLDFGIAKAAEPRASTDALSTKALTLATAAGTTLGTIQYMAPEQLDGRGADARSDVFALGAVLYEMATGRRAFPGDSYAAIAANILGGAPPPIPGVPALDRLVRGCLEEDPDRRWQSAQDVARQLSTLGTSDVADRPAARGRSWLPWAIAVAALALAAAALIVNGRGRREGGALAGFNGTVAFPMAPPSQGDTLSYSVETPTIAVAPDGSHLAFIASSPGAGSRVWLRPLGSLAARPVDGTHGATSVFWSPDSRTMAFFADGWLKRVDRSGGTPVGIAAVRQTIGQSGTWGSDGTILFASVQGEAIFRVAASGGEPAEIVKPDPQQKERRVVWPFFLPGRSDFLYLVTFDDGLGAIRLMQRGSAKEVLRAKSNVQYVEPGYLVFARDSLLLARRFDAETGQVSGDPVAVADPVTYFFPTGLAQFSASPSGVVALQSQTDQVQIGWFDRAGKHTANVGTPGGYQTIRLSSDGRQLLFERRNPRTNAHDIYLLEMNRGTEVQITNEMGSEAYPLWGPDGTLIFAKTTGGPPRVHRRPLHSTVDEALAPQPGSALQQTTDISRDHRWVLFSQRSTRGEYDILALQLTDKKIVPLRDTESNEIDARFSPDGRYVAYVSNEGGRSNVYVMSFPAGGVRRAVSSDGGTHPRWSADGRHLYYLSLSTAASSMMMVPITLEPSLEIGAPARLFAVEMSRRWIDYIPVGDGRFLAVEPVQHIGNQPLTIIANWPASLR